MRIFVLAFVALIPLTILSQTLGGSAVEPAHAVAVVTACLVVAGLLCGQLRLSRFDLWLVPFLMFLLVCGIWLPFSPYYPDSMKKGLVQLGGITVMLATSVGISHWLSGAGSLRVLVRSLVVVMSALASVGVWQFVAYNLGFPSLANFSFFNGLLFAGEVWREPDPVGGLYRANSLSAEPSHFAVQLGVASGLALARIGLAGRRVAGALRDFVPLWAALLILTGFAVSASLVGIFLLLLCALGLILLLQPAYKSALVLTGLAFPIVTAALLLFSFSSDPEGGILTKFQSIAWLSTAVSANSADSIPTKSMSAAALGTNLLVALASLESSPIFGVGIGAHPSAYAMTAPEWSMAHPTLYFLNADDAGSLLIRLLSETGSVGTLLFVSSCAIVLLRARSAIRTVFPAMTPELALTVAMTASCFAVLVTFLGRMGVYYSPSLWFLLAFSAAIPRILAGVK